MNDLFQYYHPELLLQLNNANKQNSYTKLRMLRYDTIDVNPQSVVHILHYISINTLEVTT